MYVSLIRMLLPFRNQKWNQNSTMASSNTNFRNSKLRLLIIYWFPFGLRTHNFAFKITNPLIGIQRTTILQNYLLQRSNDNCKQQANNRPTTHHRSSFHSKSFSFLSSSFFFFYLFSVRFTFDRTVEQQNHMQYHARWYWNALKAWRTAVRRSYTRISC